jgi:cold shock CspA family protein
MQGQIVTLKRDRRFGFLRDEAGQERFFGANNCVTRFETLREGLLVSFEPVQLLQNAAVDKSGKAVTGLRADLVKVLS